MAKKKAISTHEEEEKTPYSPEIEQLLAKGRERGYITQPDITKVFGEGDDNQEELDDLHAALVENNIEIVDPKEQLVWADAVDEAEAEAARMEEPDEDYIKDIA